MMQQSADEMAVTEAEPVVLWVGKGMGRWEAAARRKESAGGPSSEEVKMKIQKSKNPGWRPVQVS